MGILVPLRTNGGQRHYMPRSISVIKKNIMLKKVGLSLIQIKRCKVNGIIPIENITGLIYLIRGQKVMLDRDIAKLYGVETKRLKEQVKRNIKRFPEDFMFELSTREYENLRSHFATSTWVAPDICQ